MLKNKRLLQRNRDSTQTEAYQSLTIREEGAAPPIYMLIVTVKPIAVASFISTSRWLDNRNHRFDILFGCTMSVFFAWIGFRLYNLPIRRGAGWSWGPRSHKHALFRGTGFPSHWWRQLGQWACRKWYIVIGLNDNTVWCISGKSSCKCVRK